MFYSPGISTLIIFLRLFPSHGLPRIRAERSAPLERFSLPDNATTIRENIDTSFNCHSRPYGYYADTENDCQLFHVCLPVMFDEVRMETFMWSFICPHETVFNQEKFTCSRMEDSIPCSESAMFYILNEKFGQIEKPIDESNVEQHEENSLETATGR